MKIQPNSHKKPNRRTARVRRNGKWKYLRAEIDSEGRVWHILRVYFPGTGTFIKTIGYSPSTLIH